MKPTLAIPLERLYDMQEVKGDFNSLVHTDDNRKSIVFMDLYSNKELIISASSNLQATGGVNPLHTIFNSNDKTGLYIISYGSTKTPATFHGCLISNGIASSMVNVDSVPKEKIETLQYHI